MSGLCPLTRTVTRPAGFEQETGLSLAMYLTAQLAKAQLWQQLPPFAVWASPIHISELCSQLKRLKVKSAPQPREFTQWTLWRQSLGCQRVEGVHRSPPWPSLHGQAAWRWCLLWYSPTVLTSKVSSEPNKCTFYIWHNLMSYFLS